MNIKLDTPSRRIALAIGISVLLHSLLLWGPNIELRHFDSSLPPLMARLEVLPNASPKPKPKPKRKAAPAPKSEPIAEPAPDEQIPLAASAPPATETLAQSEDAANAASAVAAASAPPAIETLAQGGTVNGAERPPLPRRAQLIFAVYKGKGKDNFKIGEVMHTLEIDDGHYVLQSVTETVGLAKLFKTYKLTQFSSGNYSRQGLQPERFFEERAERLVTQRNTVDFDRTAQRAHFSHGGEAELPPDTQDILSILYQFPPLANAETVSIFVSNGKKIERYEFEIAANEKIQTAMGELRTMHLRKLHQRNEAGLEVWLALEYRLFPVKMRIIENDGEISGEAVITGIHAEFEEETKQDADH